MVETFVHRLKIEAILKKTRKAAVLLLGFALIALPPQVGLGQSDQQQQQREQEERERQQREQQQREQQQRDQQQREQQQREQQERERQQREQQQREQQERDQQQRERQQYEQQQREQQQRAQQEREQQQRQQQEHEQQQREHQHREQQEREQQERERQERMQQQQRSASDSGVTKSKASSKDSRPTTSDIQSDRQAAPKPVQLKPVASDTSHKVCKDGPCQDCPRAQTKAKDGSCVAVKNSNVPGAGGTTSVTQQSCPAGQTWNGAQCVTVGVQQCLPNQTKVGTTCLDCSATTGGAQNIIMELRNARSNKDEVCRKNPTGLECQQAEAHYNLTFTEYENFLGGVPMECRTTLPDPIAI
jgi:hypothetical protein